MFIIFQTFDSTNNKMVIAYRDLGNSGYGELVLYLEPVLVLILLLYLILVITEDMTSTFDSSNGKVINQDGSNSQKEQQLFLVLLEHLFLNQVNNF